MLIENGSLVRDPIEYAGLSEEDVPGALRLKEGCEGLSKVKAVYPKRSGDISFIISLVE